MLHNRILSKLQWGQKQSLGGTPPAATPRSDGTVHRLAYGLVTLLRYRYGAKSTSTANV